MAFLKLGKKQKEKPSSEKEKPKDTSKEKMPSELPTLAQDVLDEAIPDEAPSTPATEEIPDELPSLDIDIGEPPKKPEPDILEEPKAEPAEVKAEPEVEEELEEPPKPASIESYFYKITDKLKKKPSEDLLEDMKSYWEKQELEKEELKTPTQQELELNLREKIAELQELETKWVESKKQLEHTKNMMTNIEAEVSIKSEELKIILDKLEKVKSIHEKIKNQPKEEKQ